MLPARSPLRRSRRALCAALVAAGPALAGCSGASAPSPPPPTSGPLTVTLGAERALPATFLGFNGENIRGQSGAWVQPAFEEALSRLRPETIRVFGGTTADYWDWRTGTFNATASAPGIVTGGPKPPLPLDVFARAASAAGATAVFDVNMVTSTLDSQLAMLGAAQQLGMPVRLVELGNELYLSQPAFIAAFPSGTAYGRVATQWIAAIKAMFPAALVAVDGFSVTGHDKSRWLHWNAGLVASVHGEDAISFHTYFASGLHANAHLDGAGAVAELLDAPYRRFASLEKRDLPIVPAGVQAWITEWNLLDRQALVQGTWGQGLADAAYALLLLGDTRVSQADNHALVGVATFAAIFSNGQGFAGGTTDAGGRKFLTPPDHPGTTPMALTATGTTLGALLGAMRQGSTATPLAFRGGPTLGSADRAGKDPAVLGASFGASAVVLNLAGAPVVLALPPSLAALPATAVAAAPGAFVTGPTSVVTVPTAPGGLLTLPPYSVTVLGRPGA